jgi:hypothetical protein
VYRVSTGWLSRPDLLVPSETSEGVIVMSDVLIERFRTLDPARPIQQPPFRG